MLGWPVRELMLASLAMARRQALEAYRAELEMWARLAPHTEKKLPAPVLPDILKDSFRGYT